MFGLPRSPRGQAIFAVVCGVVALVAAVRLLDRLFWTDLLKQRGGDVRTTADGDIYAVDLSSSEFGDRDVAIATRIPTLERLDLEDSRTTDRGLTSICQVETLEELDLSRTSITDAGLAGLCGLQQLEVLKLNGCPHLTVRGLLQLRDLPRLHVVEIAGIDVTYAELRRLQARFPVSTRNLDPKAVCGIRGGDERVLAGWSDDPHGVGLHCRFQVTGEWLSGLDSPEAVTGLSMQSHTADAVAALPSLRRLHWLNAAALGDRSVAVLTECRELRSLELRDSSITDAGLKDLILLEHLQRLSIASPNIRGESFVVLKNLRELQSLSLICPDAETGAVMTGLRALAQLSHLESLHLELPISGSGTLEPLRSCGLLRNMRLCNCGLTDESLAQLGALPQVVSLNLRGNRLSAACGDTLAQWATLEEVYLDEDVRETIPSDTHDGRIHFY